MNITISEKTKGLLRSVSPGIAINNDQVNLLDVKNLLQSDDTVGANATVPPHIRKQQEQLLRKILKDIKQHYSDNTAMPNGATAQTGHHTSRWSVIVSFAALMIIGFESFDGMASILGLFALNPWITFVVACGVCVGAALLHKLLHALTAQNNYIEKQLIVMHEIALCVEDILNNAVDPNLIDLKETVQFLKHAQKMVSQENSQRVWSRKHMFRMAAQYAITGFLSGIIFCGGFFTGQAVAFFIAGLFVATAATAWPVLIPAIGIGLLAATIYMIEQYPTIKNAIRHWFGFSVEEAHDSIAPESILKKLDILEKRISEKQQLCDQAKQISALEQALAVQDSVSSAPPVSSRIVQNLLPEQPVVSESSSPASMRVSMTTLLEEHGLFAPLSAYPHPSSQNSPQVLFYLDV